MGSKNNWLVPLIIAILSLAVSAWASYSNNDKALSQRISVVETQQLNDGKSIDRVATDTKEIRKTLDEFYRQFMSRNQK